MSHPIEIQLGMFGGFAEVAEMHVVAAHTRVRADGSEVFVGEHLRWNKGRQPTLPRPPRPTRAAPEGHPTLFEWEAPEPSGQPSPQLEARPSADQLSLW